MLINIVVCLTSISSAEALPSDLQTNSTTCGFLSARASFELWFLRTLRIAKWNDFLLRSGIGTDKEGVVHSLEWIGVCIWHQEQETPGWKVAKFQSFLRLII